MDGSLPEQQMGSATLLSKSTCVHQRVGGGVRGTFVCMSVCMCVCVCGVWMTECLCVYGGCVWVCLVKRRRLESTVRLLIINCLFVVGGLISC